MKNITNILDYFMPSEFMTTPLKYDYDRNIIITEKSMNSFGKLENYTNWLMSMISYSKELDIELVKLIKLIKEDKVKGLGWYYEYEFILIFLHSLESEEKAFKTTFNQ